MPQRRVRTIRHEGTWIDVGTPAAYLAGNLAVLTTTLPIALDPLPRAGWARMARGSKGQPPGGVVVDGCAWVGQQARIGHGARLRDTIVGDGATVSGAATLERCVVWDGVTVPGGHWRDHVFHDGGALRATT